MADRVIHKKNLRKNRNLSAGGILNMPRFKGFVVFK